VAPSRLPPLAMYAQRDERESPWRQP
jgi:hypothetical protein